MGSKNSISIVIPEDIVYKTGGLVILPLRKYEELYKRAVISDERIDKLLKKKSKDYREKKI